MHGAHFLGALAERRVTSLGALSAQLSFGYHECPLAGSEPEHLVLLPDGLFLLNTHLVGGAKFLKLAVSSGALPLTSTIVGELVALKFDDTDSLPERRDLLAFLLKADEGSVRSVLEGDRLIPETVDGVGSLRGFEQRIVSPFLPIDSIELVKRRLVLVLR